MPDIKDTITNAAADLGKRWNGASPEGAPTESTQPSSEDSTNETLDTDAHPGSDALAIDAPTAPRLSGDYSDDDPEAGFAEGVTDAEDDYDEPGISLEPETIARIAQETAAIMSRKPRRYLRGVRTPVGTSVPVQILVPDDRRTGTVWVATDQRIRIASDAAEVYGGPELPILSTPLSLDDGLTDGLWALATGDAATVDVWVVTE